MFEVLVVHAVVAEGGCRLRIRVAEEILTGGESIFNYILPIRVYGTYI